MRPVRFQVEQLRKDQTDYGYWASGGYDPERKCGQFWIAVSPHGRPLKEINRMREQNGRHVLHVVYRGCYILLATCKEPPVIEMELFLIKEIDQEAAEAVCERVLVEDMTQRRYDWMQPSMNLARMECITPYNQNNHYYWRGQNE
jgi:hypothetical protein